ncbi:recombinase [Aquitalea sp. FJL05]|uniref:site-specific recombinase n=1 Tax=Aquitalea TaxID=407217 RepID=UPI000F5AF271|nr:MULTISPECIES: site-specific recombinase [Aquitalea]RQO71183.1 recombinase [Aquitalea sp. FJL05]
MTNLPNPTLDSIFQSLSAGECSSGAALAELVRSLRPSSATDHEQAVMNLRALAWLLEHNPTYRQALRSALLELLTQTRQIPLYTESGILANTGFFSTLSKRVGERLLPMPIREDSLQDRFGRLFRWKQDHIWLAGIPDETWQQLWQAMAWPEEENRAGWVQTRLQMVEAVQILSARVTAIGLEPELVRVYPDIERFESPFLHLNAAVLSYADSYRRALADDTALAEDDKHVLVLLDQCEEILGKIRKNASRNGISVNLTYQALRLLQSLNRLRALLSLLEPGHDPGHNPALFHLILDFARAENRKYSVSDVFKSNTELLALQVTEHAGRHGEHYIAESRREWGSMAKAAMGAGLIVGVMALIKLLLAQAHLPLLWEGLSYGLNYAVGFIIVQLLHFTIATKQPAMTAARIAAALHQQEKSGPRVPLDELAELVVKVMRTQFVAILGNVLLAIPTAAIIALGWQALFGQPVVGTAKAQHLLHDLDPLGSLALVHAGIAGVYLFLSGLIAGYYDNKAIYRRIPERLAAHPLLNKLLGKHRAWQLGHYVEHNLGALAGNFYFGLFLGLTGTIGIILGLPLDIRHITFSAANLAFGLVALDFQLPLGMMALYCGGVALIGFTNLAVSFSMALWVALRSRKLSGRQVLPLLPLLLKRFIRQPLQFFIPPAAPRPAADEAAGDKPAGS